MCSFVLSLFLISLLFDVVCQPTDDAVEEKDDVEKEMEAKCGVVEEEEEDVDGGEAGPLSPFKSFLVASAPVEHM